MDFRKDSETVLTEIASVVSAVDAGEVSRFVERLMAAPRVFVTGEGRSGFVAKSFAMRLGHLEFDVHVVGETTTPSIAAGDLLVAVSGSGETPVALHIAKAAKAAGATVSGIVSDADTALTRIADAAVIVPGRTKHGKGKPSAQMPGTLFEQCALVVLDSIVLELMRLKNKSHDDMRKRHANLE
jgi:6-phospho-3-hexuloisomerase